MIVDEQTRRKLRLMDADTSSKPSNVRTSKCAPA